MQLDTLRDIILGEAANGIADFFRDVCHQSHDYVVFMARRCYNLYYLFESDMEPVIREREALFSGRADHAYSVKPVSNNALLLGAKEIARFYDDTGLIPRILLVDEMLLHGRGISCTISLLEEAIIYFSADREQLRTNSARATSLHRKLIEALDVRVYAMRRHNLAMDLSVADKLTADHYFNTNELRILSARITKVLIAANLPYTTYTASTFLMQSQCDLLPENSVHKGWRHTIWNDNDINWDIYLKDTADRQATASVLCRLSDDGRLIRLTGRLLFRNIQEGTVDSCLKKLDDILGLDQFFPKAFVDGTDGQSELPQNLSYLRLQILSFLISAGIVCDFSSSFSLPHAGEGQRAAASGADRDFIKRYRRLEFSKYAHNFGMTDDKIKELCDLIEANCVKCLEVVHLSAGPEQADEEKAEKPEIRQLPEEAEEIMCYECGMKAERDAFLMEQRLEPLKSHEVQRNAITLTQFFVMLQNQGQKPMQWDDVICCILIFSETGILSINSFPSDNPEKKEKQFELMLKAGELSTFVIPRRISLFIPALVEIEYQYRYQMDLVPMLLKRFVESLKKPLPLKDKSEAIRALAEKQFYYLKNHYEKIIDRVYTSGHTFSGWNINWNFDDMRPMYKDMQDQWDELFSDPVSSQYAAKADEFLAVCENQALGQHEAD